VREHRAELEDGREGLEGRESRGRKGVMGGAAPETAPGAGCSKRLKREREERACLENKA
jgi:hypothetical protein